MAKLSILDKTKLGALVKGGKTSDAQESTTAQNPKEEITSVNDLSCALAALKGEISPDWFQVLKSQMQVLGTVSSPTMTGMMIDNLVHGLELALKSAGETTAPIIRESYIRLIQNYVFLSEAKLHQFVDKNKKEAYRLLSQSVKMLSDTFTDIAMNALPGGQAADILKSAGNSLFSKSPSGDDFLSTLLKLSKAKADIKEKQNEFYSTIENLFDTFEKYPDLFGRSILINGMLAKYRKVLVKRYSESKIDIIKNRSNPRLLNRFHQLTDELTESLKKRNWLEAAKSTVNTVLDTAFSRKTTLNDLQSFFMMYDSFNAEISQLKTDLDNEESRLKQLEDQKKSLGLFSFSQKKDSEQSIKEQKDLLKEKKKQIKELELKFNELKGLFPEAKAVKEAFLRYDARLESIEMQYLPL